MKNGNRICAALLAALLLVTAASCAKQSDNGTTATTAPAAVETTATETTSNVDANGYLKDDIPDNLDFKEAEVSILYWADVEKPEFFAESVSGEIVNDAIFNRNAEVEKRLNVKLVYTGKNGNFNNQSVFVNAAESSVMAGNGEFDIFSAYSMTTATLAYRRLVVNLLDYDVLDFEKPWWPDNLIKEATINNKLFFASGDISTNLLHMMYSTFFNKQLLEKYNLSSPYDIVLNGKWTMDKLIEMSTGVYADLNGNNQKDDLDQFGFSTYEIHYDSLFTASDLKIIDKDSEDNISVSPSFGSDKTQDLLIKLCDFFYNTNDALGKPSGGNGASELAFSSGRVLFITDRSYLAENKLRDADFEYGVLPVPKYDENQENYVTCMAFPYSLYAISKDSKQGDTAAAVLECLASEGYRQVTPALFETAMKIKYASDDQTAQMYDIIRSTVSFDLGRLYCSTLQNLSYSLFRTSIKSNNTNWASTYKSASGVLGKYVVKISDALNG